MYTLSFCRTSTDPAVTMSLLSSVVFVSAYSAASFFSMLALVPSSAKTAKDIQTSKLNIALYIQRILMTVFSSFALKGFTCHHWVRFKNYTPSRFDRQCSDSPVRLQNPNEFRSNT